MHHIYHTKGIILGSRNFGEAGKHYKIFTRELGMVTAAAEGVRKLSSKLRFVLQDFSYLDIDLISGKNIFRLTTAAKTNKLEYLTKRTEILKIIFNVARLLTRLMPEAMPSEVLFDDLITGLALLEKAKTKNDFGSIEAIIVLRIIDHLGYMQSKKNLKDLTQVPFKESILPYALKEKRAIFTEINRALKETHL